MRLGNPEGGHNRFREQGEIGAVEFENYIQLNRAEDDAVRARNTAAAQSGARTAGDHGGFGFIGQTEHPRNLFRADREGHAPRHLTQRRRAVERVGDEILRLGEHVFAADQAPEAGDNFFTQRHKS